MATAPAAGSFIIDEATGDALTSIACHTCRKRKIKCNRVYPECSNCTLTQQICTYPVRVARPGPKIGSTQTSRKRNHEGGTGAQSKKTNTNSAAHGANDAPVSRPPPPPPTATPPLPAPPSLSSASMLQQPLSPAPSTLSTTGSHPSRDITSLSFILHPSLQHSEYDCEVETGPSAHAIGEEDSILSSSAYALGVDVVEAQQMIDEFFDSFTPFQLFRRNTFPTKLNQIASLAQAKALLASIFIFAVRSRSSSPDAISGGVVSAEHTVPSGNTSDQLRDLAIHATDEAISECDQLNEQLPLAVIQALILISQWLLSKSAHGRAWRYLGLAIRSAYDLNLHMIDAGKSPSGPIVDSPERWCLDEEKRRAWWALWEMDVYVSVIRRRPLAISWTHNHTWLPAEDERWANSDPQQSCILSASYVDRWKLLYKTGNKSSKAWFILINSLMKDSQLLSSPMTADTIQDVEQDAETFSRLQAMHNVLHCTTERLPGHLRYENQFLTFDTKDVEVTEAPFRRARDSAIYSIHLMTQLTRMMIYKFYVFRTRLRWPQLQRELATMKAHAKTGAMPERQLGSLVPTNAVRQALMLYITASENVVNLIQRTNGPHYKYVNPFLANTIWLAAAVQLLHKELTLSKGAEQELISSNFELLCMAYHQFVEYWDMADTLQCNLETLERELKNLQLVDGDGSFLRKLSFNSQSGPPIAAGGAGSVTSRASIEPLPDSSGGAAASLMQQPFGTQKRSDSGPLAGPLIRDSATSASTTRTQHSDLHDRHGRSQQPQATEMQSQLEPDQGLGSGIAAEESNNNSNNNNNNYNRVSVPVQQRQGTYSSVQSPLPGLSGDIFGETTMTDALRFDECWKELGSRTDFYDNLNFVLSGPFS